MVAIFTGAGSGFDRGSASVLGARGQVGTASLGRGGETVAVNASSGALTISRSDEILIGRGPDLAPTLNYSSGANGWLHGWIHYLSGLTGTVNTAGSTITLAREFSDRTTFAYDTATGSYVSKEGAGAYDEIRYSGGVWSWLDGDTGVTDYFEHSITTGSGPIFYRTRKVDRDGNTQTYSFDSTNRIQRITNADGGYAEFTYNQLSGQRPNEIRTYAAAGGAPTTRVRYTWDTAVTARMLSATIDLSPQDDSIADGNTYVTSYTYDGTSRRVASITQTDGSLLSITYDASGRVETLTETISAGVTRTTTLAYHAGYTTVTDATGGVTRLDYDAQGQLTKITQPPASTGATAQTTSFAYNSNGDVISATDAFGNVTTYTHDSNGNVLTETDRLGNTVWRSYGTKNELLTETRRGSDSAAADAFHVTRYVYDAEGHLRYVVSPRGMVTEHRYTAAGELNATIEYPEASFVLTSGSGAVVASASYETPEMGNDWQFNPAIAGMTFTGNAGIAGNNHSIGWGFADAPDGDQVAFVQSYSDVYGSAAQSLSGLVPGGTYNVKFLLAARQTYGATPVAVTFNGVALGTFSPASTAFQEFTATFIATGPTGTLTFTSAGPMGHAVTAIDNVRVIEMRPSEADLDAWRDAIPDRSSTKIATHLYDARGNLTQTNRHTTSLAGGGATSAAGISQTYYTYDQAGQLLSRRADGEFAETFVYDGLGRVVASTDRNQGTTNIVFNDSATQTVVTLASGYVKTSTYDKAGNLVSETQSGSFVAAGAATASKYDKLDRLRMVTDATGFNTYFVYDKVGRLVAEVDHRGGLTEYRYDAGNRRVATTRYIHAVASANLTLLANPDSTVEMSSLRPALFFLDVSNWTTYDQEGRVTSTMDGTVRTYEYDASGRLVKTVAYYNGLSSSQIAEFKTNPPTAPVIPAADSRDVVTRTFYDDAGRTIGTLDGEGYLTVNSYDLAGQLVERVAYSQRAPAALRATATLALLLANQSVGADDRHTHYAYDAQGLLRFEVDALNQVVEYGYDVARNPASTIRYAGSIPATTDFTWDNVTALVASSGLASASATRRSWTVYNESGLLAYAIDPEGAVSRNYYNAAGQVTKSVRFAAARPTVTWPGASAMDNWAAAQNANADNRVTRYYYTAAGQLKFTVDAEGYLSRTDYDGAGRTIGEYRWNTAIPAGDSTTIDTINALQTGTWTGQWYSYGFGGPVTDVYNADNGWYHYDYHNTGQTYRELNVGLDLTYTYHGYDLWGRTILRADASGVPEGADTQYEYDGLGNLKTVTDARGNATSRTFDKLGRVLTETDALGGIVSYEYDAFGEVTKVTDARGYATTKTYDRLGRLLSVTDALGNVTSHDYSVFGDLLTVTRGAATTSFDYDRLGRVVKTTDAEGHYEQYTLDAYGNRIAVRNKIGGIVVNSYDRRGLLTAEVLPMSSTDANGNVVAATVTNKFEYDARGNRTRKTEAFGLPEVRNTLYFYDFLDRLVETRGDAVWTMNSDWVNSSVATPSEKLKYDQRGRVTERTDALGARTLYYYDEMGRVTVELGAVGTYTAFTYDKNGNVLTRRVYGTAVALPAAAGGTKPSAPGGEYRETAYSYDALNRLKTTSVANIRTGAWNVTAYSTDASVTVTTGLDYDSNGNVVRTVDGNSVSAFAYYDKENRKIAEVDREGFLTFYTLDGEGNVTREDRYASAVAGAAIGSDPNALRAAAGAASRVTLFTYDRNGRRLSETRVSVNAHALDGNGTVVAGASDSTINYTYNGLGEVTRKTEANGDYIDYAYDNTGRLLEENRAPYADLNGTAVRPTIGYRYNGLNELSLTRQGGAAAAAGDRYTRYTYGPGGRVATMTDANGATYHYLYDVAGNVVRESYYRYKADGSFTIDSLLYARDQLGRVTSQGLATWGGNSWVWIHGDRQNIAYNAYGDVAQRGVNGMWQEQLGYDTAGRLVKSNSGDGVWRFFVYDGNGNRTLTLESEGMDLAACSVDQAIAAATAGGSVGGAWVDDIVATIAIFDKRGQQTGTRLPFRELKAGTIQTPTSARSYNAWGEVTSETDALNNTTNFTYNNMGRLIQKQSPEVGFTIASTTQPLARPTEKYYYDISGRMIATDVAVDTVNSNRITRALLAGTGHGESEALVTYEYHGDGGYLRNAYDVFGDKRVSWDEIFRRTDMSYDAMGRLTQQSKPNGLVENYAYDLLGQRISHWNSLLGWGNVETTTYDMQGRVTAQTAFGGDTTTTSYVWNPTLATALGTSGGWTETTTLANGRSSTEQTDLYGRKLYRSDLGGHVHNFSYDKAGRMTERTGADPLSFTWFNTGKLGESYSIAGTIRKGTTYGYDKAGRLVSEKLLEEGSGWSHTYKNATASYDEAGRLKSWDEVGSSDMAGAGTDYFYDLAGNIRRIAATYHQIDANGAISAGEVSPDIWYSYDSLNRLVTKGVLAGGQVVRGVGGVDYLYDKAGQRMSATRSAPGTATVNNPWYEPGESWRGPRTFPVDYTQSRREDYTYDLGGALETVRIAEGGYTDNGDGTATPTAPPAYARLRASYTNDLMGRVIRQIDYVGDGTDAAYDRSVLINAKGQIYSETIIQKQGADTLKTVGAHDFGTGANYALGAVVASTTSHYKWVSGSYQSQGGSTDSTGYAWYDGAVQSSVAHTQTGNNVTTGFTYDGSGALVSVAIADSRSRTVSFVNDANGQAIKRDEADYNVSAGDPHEVWHRFGGKQMGHVGNNGTLDTDYATSIANRTIAPGTGAFRFGSANGAIEGDFDLSGEGFTSYGQGVGAGGYTVREGDTLETIAASLWGDSALWYKLAEANGLTGSGGLAEGRRLSVPAGAIRSHHNASTFKPYDPAETIGDLSPATPKPQKAKSGKCGTFGIILLVAIAVAVTVVTSGAFLAATGAVSGGIGTGIGAFVAGTAGFTSMVAAGAVGGAVGSIASQGFGVATGIQDKFSWKAVALAGLAGGISAGLGHAFPAVGAAAAGSQTATKLGTLSLVGRGAFIGVSGSALTQGVGTLVGLQKKFDFAGVAAAGLAGGASAGVGKALGAGPLSDLSARNIGANLATSTANAIANAATRSLINGSDFGDNMLAALPDIIGSTIGNMIGSALAGDSSSPAARMRRAHRAVAAMDGQDELTSGARSLTAQALEAMARDRNLRIKDAAADPEIRAIAMAFGIGASSPDPEVRLAAADHLMTSGLRYSPGQVAAARSLAQPVINDLSRRAEYIGLAPDEIVVTGTSNSRIARVLGSIGHFVEDHGSDPLVVGASFVIGAMTAPISTAIFTALDYTPGVGDVVRRVEGMITAKAMDFGSRAVQRFGVSSQEAPYVVIGGLTFLGLVAFGGAGIRFARNAFASARAHFSRNGPDIHGSREVTPFGEVATRQLLGTSITPGGRQIMYHAADRMVHPPRGRAPMTVGEVDQVLDGATSVVKRTDHPDGPTLTIENANMPGRPRVVVDEATGQRVITVVNPRRRR